MLNRQEVQPQGQIEPNQVQGQNQSGAASGASQSADKVLTFPNTKMPTFPSTLKAIETHLEISEATLKNKWFSQKIVPIYEGYKCPTLRTSEGVTEFGYQAIQRFIQKVVKGSLDYEQYAKQVRAALTPIRPEPVEDEMFQSIKDLAENRATEQTAITLRNAQALVQSNSTESVLAALQQLVAQTNQNQALLTEAEEAEIRDRARRKALQTVLIEQQELAKVQAALNPPKRVRE